MNDLGKCGPHCGQVKYRKELARFPAERFSCCQAVASVPVPASPGPANLIKYILWNTLRYELLAQIRERKKNVSVQRICL